MLLLQFLFIVECSLVKDYEMCNGLFKFINDSATEYLVTFTLLYTYARVMRKI